MDVRCGIPGWSGDSYGIQSEEHRVAVRRTIPITDSEDPEYSQCSVFSPGWNLTTVGNHREDSPQLLPGWNLTAVLPGWNLTTDSNHREDSPQLLPGWNLTAVLPGWNHSAGSNHSEDGLEVTGCKEWVYNTSEMETSVITQFDLVCDRKAFRAHLNMGYLVGIAVSLIVSGYLCDWYGRKIVLCVNIVLLMVAGLASAFPPSPEVLLVCRALAGSTGSGVYMSAYILMVEMVGVDTRNQASSMLCIVWVVGPFVLAAVSFLVRQWHFLQLISVLPLVLCLGHWWGVITMIYYGLSLNVDNIGGSVRINFLLSSTVELIGYVLCWILVDRLGRKRSHCCFMLTAGLACLAAIPTVSSGKKELENVTVALAILCSHLPDFCRDLPHCRP
ncbi:hypothetical protein ACOMHN_055138 [Nucella lapillus]